ncbi:MAG: hypothetical protein FRX49_09716 [Trebouxia sp. A1-2]|nr:MAG: hypothetical protein FRX49_09716 [Trebouxia sp. A1-2]
MAYPLGGGISSCLPMPRLSKDAHLYPRVDLQEVVVAILVNHELHRASIAGKSRAKKGKGIGTEGKGKADRAETRASRRGTTGHHVTLQPKEKRERKNRASSYVAPWCTTLMPRPPPPIAAFRMTGKPAPLANLRADWASVMGSLEPGTVGTPHSSANLLAVLESHLDSLGCWADEHNPFLTTPSGKGGVLAEEAVPWMDCIHRLLLSKGNDGFNV